MDTEPSDPGLSVDPSAARCPHCGGGCGVGSPTAENCALLAEVSDLGRLMLATLRRKVQATDDVVPADAMMLETVSRTIRRTVAMHEKIYANGQKTPEQRAAEDIRRAEAAERARFRVRKPPAPLTGEALIRREPGPSDRENLLSDMNERLLPREFDGAVTQQDLSTIILDILKQFGIVPKNETWSVEMMAAEVSAVHAELKRREAERAAADVPPEPAETTPAPGECRKVGRFTYGPSGAVVAEDPPDPPQSAWPENILGGRELPDLLKGRGPPRSG